MLPSGNQCYGGRTECYGAEMHVTEGKSACYRPEMHVTEVELNGYRAKTTCYHPQMHVTHPKSNITVVTCSLWVRFIQNCSINSFSGIRYLN